MSHNRLQRLRYTLSVVILVFFSAGQVWAGGGTVSGPEPYPAPYFEGVKTKTRPCKFDITLRSDDPYGELVGFAKASGEIPEHHTWNGGSLINGYSTCAIGTWTSGWKARYDGNVESAASTLTLRCNEGQSPSAPTYGGGPLHQTSPCSFFVVPNSVDANSDPITFRISDASCLPPGHAFNGSSISGGPVYSSGTWTCTFTADDSGCEQLKSSAVTMRCDAPAPGIDPCLNGTARGRNGCPE